MTSLYGVLLDGRFVVIDLYALVIQYQGIPQDVSIDIFADGDGCTSAKFDYVVLDSRRRVSPLNENSIGPTMLNVVLYDSDGVLVLGLDHDCSRFEVDEVAFLNVNICMVSNNTHCLHLI